MAFARWVALTMIFAACSTATEPAATIDAAAPTVLLNQGGQLEGHTPRGFAGMGTGLFAGDNLNPGFPDGDGVQIYLTFEPVAPLRNVSSAVLTSESLTVRGSPFGDLGVLSAEAVSYDAFGPDLFDLEAISPPVACRRVGDSAISCDVTEAVAQSVAAGESRFQFRLRFDVAGDGDGSADLALFFITDSNANEAGIFALTIED